MCLEQVRVQTIGHRTPCTIRMSSFVSTARDTPMNVLFLLRPLRSLGINVELLRALLSSLAPGPSCPSPCTPQGFLSLLPFQWESHGLARGLGCPVEGFQWSVLCLQGECLLPLSLPYSIPFNGIKSPFPRAPNFSQAHSAP